MLLSRVNVHEKFTESDKLKMQLVQGLEKIEAPYSKAVVTIGNFDGVHKGHQALFQKICEAADQINGTSVVITFEPHPARVLTNKKSPPLITIFEQKMELIDRAGVDVCLCIPFSRKFAAVTAADFVEETLVKQLGLKIIVVGADYTFGKNRVGNLDFLKECSKKYGFEVVCLEDVISAEEARISSTSIREIVTQGDMHRAFNLLGRYYQIRGKVVAGRDRGGKALGFPTANIELDDELCPAMGVYAVLVEHDSKQYQGVANLGYSPTFGDHIFTVEVHILNFNKKINDHKIQVSFVERIRDEKKFASLDELIAQIKKDISCAGDILSAKDVNRDCT